MEGRPDDFESDFPHGFVKVLHAVVLPAELVRKVALKLSIAQFVPLLVLPVFLAVLLDGVVGQVHEFIAQVLQIIQRARSLNVAFLVEVKLESPVDAECEEVGPNIEFPSVVQEGVFNVLLNDELFLVQQPRLNLIQRTSQSNPLSAIGIFAWLQDPKAALVLG